MSVIRNEEQRRPGGEYVVTLPVFEGPLDLLLHLIQKHELDILDIPVSFVTEKYVEYISLMQAMSIDVTSEYLVMAATLVHIKSKMLLPPGTTSSDEEEQLEDGLDPREELIRRLLEYQKYKQAAADLNERGALGRDVFARGATAPEAEGPAPLARVEVWNLLDAFAKVLSRAKVKVEHEISFDQLSITERIQQLCDRLAERRTCTFEELFEGQATRGELVITFLALLEMTKLRLTRLYQVDPLAPIHIELSANESAFPPADAAVERGGELESGFADAAEASDRSQSGFAPAAETDELESSPESEFPLAEAESEFPSAEEAEESTAPDDLDESAATDLES